MEEYLKELDTAEFMKDFMEQCQDCPMFDPSTVCHNENKLLLKKELDGTLTCLTGKNLQLELAQRMARIY